MKKRFLAVLLVLGLLSAVFAGCSAGQTEESSSASVASTSAENSGEVSAAQTTEENVELQPYKIAVGLKDSGATMFTIMHNNIARFCELTGGEFYFEGGIAGSADATISFVENQIAAGVNGILIAPPNDAVLTTVASLCEEAGVYWGITFRSILDDEIRGIVEASPYYVGRCYEDEVETGYGVMKNLHEMGIQKVAIISTEKGNTTGDLREEGIAKACTEFGMEVIAEARGLAQASDVTSAVESFLSAYSDLDCIFQVATTASGAQEAIVKAIQDAGRADDVKFAVIDFPDVMDELFSTGVLVTCSGLASWGYDPFMSFTLLANTCMGYPVSEDGSKLAISMPMYTIQDQETAVKWMEKFGNDTTMYYTDDEMKALVKAWDPDLDADTIRETVTDFTENVVSE